ncbi:hypothetical protein [Fimbriiglobus ruber]|uniref:Uncharacterized protein n=1 Tax=Fimbriiglobus ruber TaxID=1908690 RepID=A0A225DN39_9BACT|nr:hypothetical protein [Fimbriiglobus ruber]OWK41104.1 hypothetical protein FRUB_04996 [Fimbriiglobus ruber]
MEELKVSWDAGLNTFILGKAPMNWLAEHFAEAAVGDACDPDAADAATWAMENAQETATPHAKLNKDGELPESTEHLPQVCLLRDIFGNPFRPVSADPSWLTSTVLMLTRQMYNSRDFSSMPILADALQDAGCDHLDILAHCGGDGPHVRGCWVVDLLLGIG